MRISKNTNPNSDTHVRDMQQFRQIVAEVLSPAYLKRIKSEYMVGCLRGDADICRDSISRRIVDRILTAVRESAPVPAQIPENDPARRQVLSETQSWLSPRPTRGYSIQEPGRYVRDPVLLLESAVCQPDRFAALIQYDSTSEQTADILFGPELRVYQELTDIRLLMHRLLADDTSICQHMRHLPQHHAEYPAHICQTYSEYLEHSQTSGYTQDQHTQIMTEYMSYFCPNPLSTCEEKYRSLSQYMDFTLLRDYASWRQQIHALIMAAITQTLPEDLLRLSQIESQIKPQSLYQDYQDHIPYAVDASVTAAYDYLADYHNRLDHNDSTCGYYYNKTMSALLFRFIRRYQPLIMDSINRSKPDYTDTPILPFNPKLGITRAEFVRSGLNPDVDSYARHNIV